MNAKKYFTLLLITAVAGVIGCVEQYTPPLSKNTPDLLVVDGFLNTSDGEITVMLTRTMPLGDLSEAPTVNNATIYLEDPDNQSTELNFQGNGKYSLTGLSIDESKSYRIRISTGQSEYVSDFVAIKNTPEIDSVTWRQSDENIEIDVHTHDPSGNSRYYLWTYDETWEYRAYYYTSLKWRWEDSTVVAQTPEDYMTNCWDDGESSKILIGSSVRLSEDVIHSLPVHYLPKGDVRISVKYSILVKQTVLNEVTYDFYKDLKKTTEDPGGLFDPQPGRVLGNVKSTTNPDEPVLGIFNAGSVSKKRLFINYSDLPRSFQVPDRSECRLDTISVDDIKKNFNARVYNIVGTISQGMEITDYTYSSPFCTDCRKRGGTTAKPDFWP